MEFWAQITIGIWCYIEVKHISDMFQSLEYDNDRDTPIELGLL